MALLLQLLSYKTVVRAMVLKMTATTTLTRVVVTGAGSSVGYECMRKLLKRNKQFYPIGLVRDVKGVKALQSIGCAVDQIVVGDIVVKDTIKDLFVNCDKAILCTSASLKKKLWFRFRSWLHSLLLFLRIAKKSLTASPSDLYYPRNQSPHDVDFVGQKHVIDLCVVSKVQHIVMLGNMGGYKGSKNPLMVEMYKWKRAAERYLMKRCFFTIIHAGILTDDRGGHREIVWDTDDSLLRSNFKKIPRKDVAEVLVQCLLWKEAIGRSLDVASKSEGQGAPTKDWLRFFSRPGDCIYPSE